MFTIKQPIRPVDALARRTVYSEFVKNHKELKDVSVGCHNDMIFLGEDAATGESVAVLVATGEPGQRVDFPRHLHTRGELTICLDGIYGEYISAGENPDDLIEGAQTLAEFQSKNPGLVELSDEVNGQIPVRLGLGATWYMGDNTQHKPFGFIGENGVLLAQIYWGGANEVLE